MKNACFLEHRGSGAILLAVNFEDPGDVQGCHGLVVQGFFRFQDLG
jgi:hypothetical protein